MVEWRVYVEDRERYADADGRRLHGSYASAESARAEARQVVERSLQELAGPAHTAASLFQLWSLYGQDAFLVPDNPEDPFSGQEYAREQAARFAAG